MKSQALLGLLYFCRVWGEADRIGKKVILPSRSEIKQYLDFGVWPFWSLDKIWTFKKVGKGIRPNVSRRAYVSLPEEGAIRDVPDHPFPSRRVASMFAHRIGGLISLFSRIGKPSPMMLRILHWHRCGPLDRVLLALALLPLVSCAARSISDSLPTTRSTTTTGDSQSEFDLARRQDIGFSEIAPTSTSSYNYWWPYPPGGVYATTTTPPTTSLPIETSPTIVLTQVPYTILLPTLSSSTPTSVQTSFAEGSSSAPYASSPQPTSDTGFTSAPSSSGSTTSSPMTSSTSTTSSQATTSAPTLENNAKNDHVQSFKAVYLVPVFLVLGLGSACGIGICIHNRRNRRPAPDAQDTYDPAGRFSYGGMSEKGRTNATESDDEEEQRFISLGDTAGAQTPSNVAHGRKLKDAWRRLRSAIGSRFNPGHDQFTFLPVFERRSRVGQQFSSVRDLPGRGPPDVESLRSSEAGHTGKESRPRRGRGAAFSAYGYGQWRDRSVRRHLDGVDLTKVYSNEGDAEEVEIDLSKGWSRFSSIRNASLRCKDASSGGGVDTADLSLTKLIDDQDDKFTTLSRKTRPQLRTTVSDSATSLSSTHKIPGSSSKYTSFLRFPFLGRSRSSRRDPSSDSNVPAASSSSATQAGEPTTPRGYGVRSSRRSERRGHQREVEDFGDELSLTSKRYSPLRDYTGTTPPPHSVFAMHRNLTYASDESDGGEDADSPRTRFLQRTPRDAHGEIRHKSLRRVLAEGLHNGEEGSGGAKEGKACGLWDAAHSTQSTPVALASDEMFSDVEVTPTPKRKTHTKVASVSEVVKAYDEQRRRRRETGTSDVESAVTSDAEYETVVMESPPPVRPLSITSKTRRPTCTRVPSGGGEWVNPPLRGITKALSLHRLDTTASTVPSIYSPQVAAASGSPSRTTSVKRFGKGKAGLKQGRLALEGARVLLENDEDVISAADMAKKSRRFKKGPVTLSPPTSNKDVNTENGRSVPVLSPAELHKAQSPLPDVPSGIMSPPLEASLFFSSSSPTKSPRKGPRTPNPKLQTSSNGSRNLNRNATTSTTKTTSSVTPPPSHFSTRARAQANSKVEGIVKHGYSAKAGNDLPSSPTAFGAWDGPSNKLSKHSKS
ncbi:hypothetical protein FRB99_005598 [Tulasnella sp. 403]|nr:hypothetical protein FRB99_005598 [Tulasnella sp. 403]